MKNIVAGSVVFLAILGCSKKSIDSNRGYLEGAIYFRNLGSYTIMIGQMEHRHGQTTRTSELARVLYPDGIYQLTSLFGTGSIFTGGDLVTIDYYSLASNPGNPQNPLFSVTVSLTVNGTSIITINDEGDFNIGGD